ncbi:unnamed protein product, partial [Symbiodinium microadriaticum]
MLQLRQEKKRRAKEGREAARAAEKKRKLEEPYRVDRQEGDVEVAGVVLRGEGVAWAEGHQVDAELVIHGVRCKAVILGSPSTLQLVGLGQAQLKPLAEAPRVFALTKGGDKFVPARVVSEGNRAAKLLDEDDRTLSRVAAVRFQINGKPALPLLQVAEPLAAEALAEKKKQLPKGASLQLHGIACRVLGPGFVQVKQVPQMLRLLRGMTPFPELKAVQVGPVQRFDAECRDLEPAAAEDIAEEPAELAAADEPDAAEDIAEEEPAAEEPEDLVDEDLVEDLEEESPEEDAVVEPDAQQVEKMRVLGQPGFDIEIQGAVATVLGDELEQECRLLMYKDGRKCGEPAEVTMVPEMVYDRRGGQVFD